MKLNDEFFKKYGTNGTIRNRLIKAICSEIPYADELMDLRYAAINYSNDTEQPADSPFCRIIITDLNSMIEKLIKEIIKKYEYKEPKNPVRINRGRVNPNYKRPIIDN